MDRELLIDNYLLSLIDVSEKLDIDSTIINLIVLYTAHGNDYSLFTKDYITQVYEIALRDTNQELLLKHRPEVVKRALTKFDAPATEKVNQLAPEDQTILQSLVKGDNSTTAIELHLEAIRVAKGLIKQAKRKYGARSVQELADVYLKSYLEPLVKQYIHATS